MLFQSQVCVTQRSGPIPTSYILLPNPTLSFDNIKLCVYKCVVGYIIASADNLKEISVSLTYSVNPGLVGSIHYTYMVGSVSMVAYHATACSTFPHCITSERRKFSRRYSFSVRFPRSDATQPVGIH